MTIPSVTRFDDFRFALYDLATGSMEVLNPDSVIDPQFETVPGVVGDRLRSCTFEVPWYSAPRTAIDFDNLQMLAIGRYGPSDQEHFEAGGSLTLWGLLLKPKEGYSKRVVGDSVQVQAVQVEELLRARKVFEYDAGAGKNLPLTFTAAKPDDIAKELVRVCFSGVDIDGNPRDWEWGTLVVEADSSQCVDNIDIAILSGTEPTDTLWKRIDDLARTYDFDYQLVPTFVGGAWVFTFRTKAPYGGSDLTTGASRVQIKDLYNLVPSGTRYRDAAFRATRMYTRGYSDSVEDAAAIATWGIWEGVATGPQLSAAEIALEKARVKEGAEYGFEATGANGMVTWVKDFKAGDKVNRANNRLSVAADSEKIAAVSGRFVDKVLQLTIRWGDREPASTDRQGGGAYNPDEGDDGLIKGLLDDALLLAEFAPDGTLPVMGNGTYETYVSTATVGGVVVDALRIRGPWSRDVTGTPFLTQRTAGDELRIKNAGAADLFYVDVNGNIGGKTYGGAYLHLDFHGYDITNLAGTGNGLHDLWMSGDIISDTASSGSDIRWVADDDEIYARKIYVDSDATLASHSITMEGATGNTTWKAAAQMNWEGVAYRMPTSVGTTGQVLVLTTGAPNQLSWAAPAPAAHNILSTSHGDTAASAVADGSIIIGNVTPKWSALAISVPAANVRNVLGVDNGETRPSWKTALDATNPATLTAAAAAAPGTSLVFAHRDHVHPITTTVVSAASTIVATDASGYIRATRLELGGAGSYVSGASANFPEFVAVTRIRLLADTGDVRLTAAMFYPQTTNNLDLGGTSNRWKLVAGVDANFSNDVTLDSASVIYLSADTNLYRGAANQLATDDDFKIVTAGKGLIMSDNTLYKVPLADGTRFVPSAIPKAALPTHAHSYDKATSTGSFTAGAFRAWINVYENEDTGSAVVGHVAGTEHTHVNATYAWTYTSTNSGSAIV